MTTVNRYIVWSTAEPRPAEHMLLYLAYDATPLKLTSKLGLHMSRDMQVYMVTNLKNINMSTYSLSYCRQLWPE